MRQYQIHIEMEFNTSASRIFATLTDHHAFGLLLGQNIRRIVDAPSGPVNGVGSVRLIQLLPGFSFEETVRSYREGELMEYQISRGGPLKSHWGRLEFTGLDQGRRCRLNYRIDFSPKIFATGALLQHLIAKPIRNGLRKLQHSCLSDSRV